ncbi:MAG: hypothetical protein LBJ76_02455 [Candidatus Accumulibacter sp.]|jgi:hypothetical protein|nr:hypothetical protein [Accumulibacter sp.]
MTTEDILNDQARKYEEARRIFIENDKALAEIEKIMAETRKIDKENRWYLLVVGATLFAAGAAFFKIFV